MRDKHRPRALVVQRYEIPLLEALACPAGLLRRTGQRRFVLSFYGAPPGVGLDEEVGRVRRDGLAQSQPGCARRTAPTLP